MPAQLYVFNQFGDLERRALRPGNVHSADGWEDVLRPVLSRYSAEAPLSIILPNERVLAFYNQRGTAEQHIEEGKHALKWRRLPCMRFAANAVWLQIHALAYNLANILRTLATPEGIDTWSLTSLRERLIKTGTRIVHHARYAILQVAEAAPRALFAGILGLISGLRGPPTEVASS